MRNHETIHIYQGFDEMIQTNSERLELLAEFYSDELLKGVNLTTLEEMVAKKLAAKLNAAVKIQYRPVDVEAFKNELDEVLSDFLNV